MLLDTQVVVWWLNDQPERLGPAARRLVLDDSTELLVSAATIWEASIKRTKGKFPETAGLLSDLERSDVELLPITPIHADRAGSLPRLHDDPFDRLLVAQAQMAGLPLVSSDQQLAAYAVEVIW